MSLTSGTFYTKILEIAESVIEFLTWRSFPWFCWHPSCSLSAWGGNVWKRLLLWWRFTRNLLHIRDPFLVELRFRKPLFPVRSAWSFSLFWSLFVWACGFNVFMSCRLSARRFRQLVERLLQFISTRLFPADPDELPPSSKCSWWIPSATKVLSLFSKLHTNLTAGCVCVFFYVLFIFLCPDAANSVSSPPIMPFTDFYNITLDHIDFMEEYRTWQNYGNSNRSDLLSHCWIFHLLAFSAEGVQTKTVFFPVGITDASQGLGQPAARTKSSPCGRMSELFQMSLKKGMFHLHFIKKQYRS